ncbi:MAG: aminomethyl-transferring glycine dehydrogenase [Chloroflexi bacterium]|nr:aminomethyl-transferring glycine dehydrogenase [Chloroflexota bacterium]|tara:strand:+ start:2617 stop:3879 length:1263 start_codon:yes stop_codon:yes gene_type:complete
MLEAIGANSIEELFEDIPIEYRHPNLNLPSPLSEMEVLEKMNALANKNLHAGNFDNFLGAGAYHHFCPSVVSSLVSRGEFLTSYTPYQPEVSQGTLQGTYEFQSITAELYGMEVSNAGMYDGATSLAEAALMSCRITKRNKIAVFNTVNAHYIDTIKAYAMPQELDVYVVQPQSYALDSDTACLIAQYPNFYGYFEDMQFYSDHAHSQGALFIMSCDPIALAMYKTPGDYGADIATGEGQALGVPLSFGGPYVGIFTCRKDYLRQMPGRISGKTEDSHGNTGYVLTLQPREQHIRREHATSNICTSTALIALWATIYTALMGKHGLKRVAELCYQKSHYAASEIAKLPGYDLVDNGPFFQEFVITCPKDFESTNKVLERSGIIGGYNVSNTYKNGMLLCVTEVNTKNSIDRLVERLGSIN